MSIVLIVSTLILLIGIGLMVVGLNSHSNGGGEAFMAGIIVSLSGLVLGFGIFGNNFYVAETTYEEVTQFTFAKTENTVLIEANGLTQTFADAKTFNSIENIEKVYIKTYLNSYGGVLRKKVVLDKDSE